jgi:hypothetical protein
VIRAALQRLLRLVAAEIARALTESAEGRSKEGGIAPPPPEGRS